MGLGRWVCVHQEMYLWGGGRGAIRTHCLRQHTAGADRMRVVWVLQRLSTTTGEGPVFRTHPPPPQGCRLDHNISFFLCTKDGLRSSVAGFGSPTEVGAQPTAVDDQPTRLADGPPPLIVGWRSAEVRAYSRRAVFLGEGSKDSPGSTAYQWL